MTELQAHALALNVLRRRLAQPHWTRVELEKTVCEGASGPDGGYLIRRGEITVDGHTFRLRSLLDELESPGLFA